MKHKYRRRATTLGRKPRPRNRTFEQLEPRELMATDLPNIIVVNTDDQRPDSLEFMPVLASEILPNATVFENSFVPTAVCAPSRASLFTGQYAHNHGVLHVNEPLGGFENFDNTATLATWLDEVGYNTAMIGKYMNGYDAGAFVNQDPNDSYVAPGWDYWRAMVGATFLNPTISMDGVNQFYAATYTTDLLSDFAEEFILSNDATDDEPFFLYFSPHNPHEPSLVADRHVGFYDDVAPHRPPSFNEADISDKPAWVTNKLPLLDQAAIDEVDQFRQDQLESMLSVDEGIGRMLDALETTGELDNTIIIYTSDNGQHWGEHRFDQKGPVWEESIRVPMVVYDGRDATAQTIDEMALNIDLAPTIMDYVLEFAPAPSQTLAMDGASLLPLIDGQSVAWRDEFLVESYSGNGGPFFGVRTEEYTYSQYRFTVGTELYDLQNDPFQLESKHDDPAYAAVLADMQSRLAGLVPADDVGPVVTEIEVVDDAGVPTLEITVSDTTTGGSEVRNAEYFIGAPGDNAQGTPLIVKDGAYDSDTEQQFIALPDNGGEPYTIFVHGRDVSGAWGEFVSLEVNPGGVDPLPGGEIVYRVNAGGEEIPGAAPWAEDTDSSASPFNNFDPNAVTSAAFATSQPVDVSLAPSAPAELFQTQRFDKANPPNLEWDFPVTPGDYEVRLYFAEIFGGAFQSDFRVFDVDIEGVEVLSDYDVFDEVGALTGVMKSFVVTSDANLDIDFIRNLGKNDPMVMGIEILTVGSGGTLEASSEAIDFGDVIVGQTASVDVTLTNGAPAGGDAITVDPSAAVISPSGPFAFDFGVTTPVVLQPGESTVVTVTYAPTATAPASATLTLPHDGAETPTTIDLLGEGQPIAGDYDGSGFVDAFDRDVWASTYGGAADLRADGNGNGVIDVGDFTIWRDNLGQGATASSASAALVQTAPEAADAASPKLEPEVASLRLARFPGSRPTPIRGALPRSAAIDEAHAAAVPSASRRMLLLADAVAGPVPTDQAARQRAFEASPADEAEGLDRDRSLGARLAEEVNGNDSESTETPGAA